MLQLKVQIVVSALSEQSESDFGSDRVNRTESAFFFLVAVPLMRHTMGVVYVVVWPVII